MAHGMGGVGGVGWPIWAKVVHHLVTPVEEVALVHEEAIDHRPSANRRRAWAQRKVLAGSARRDRSAIVAVLSVRLGRASCFVAGREGRLAVEGRARAALHDAAYMRREAERCVRREGRVLREALCVGLASRVRRWLGTEWSVAHERIGGQARRRINQSINQLINQLIN